MCGIVGFSGRKNYQLLERMLKKIDHRGPDETVFFKGKQVSLGMKRLAIIDLRQKLYPLKSKDGQLILVFNGEIYNYRQLRKQLEKEGKKLKTKLDAEVILFLYQRFGEKCLNFLEGMFSFTIYDQRKKILFSARDRFGEKPFYYCFKKGSFVFASEARALLKHPLVSSKINYQAFYYYLRFGFIPKDLSIFADIKKLLPGHFLIYSLKDKKLYPKKYWDIDFLAKTKEVEEKNALKKIKTELVKSVKQRLISDVPVGLFLSGGVDSAILTALVKKIRGKRVETFTVKVNAKGLDESQKSSKLAQYLKTNNNIIDFGPQDLVDNLGQLLKISSQPICDPAAAPTFKMSRLARKKVKVVLTGEGADELFAGYPRYLKELRLVRKRRLLPKIFSQSYQYSLPYNLIQAFSNLSVSYFPQQHFTLRKAKKIINKNLHDRIDFYQDPFSRFKSKKFRNNLDLMLYIDLKTRLPDELLIKTDRTTMFNGLEARAPYLSKDLAEYAVMLPLSLKIGKKDKNKYLLRKLAAEYLPKSFSQQEKHSFSLPLDQWLRKDVYLFIKESFESINGFGRFFNLKFAKRILEEHRQGRDHSLRVWSLVCFINWYKNI